jgi:hypothetical protein
MLAMLQYKYHSKGGASVAALSESKRRANNKYIKENMTVLGCKVRKDYADRIRAAAASQGDTVNAIIKRGLDAYLEEYEPYKSEH